MFKKLLIIGIALVFALLSLAGCATRGWRNYEFQEGDFVLEVSVDRTIVSVGDTVEITATFKNLSGKNLPIVFRANRIFDRLDERIISTVLIPKSTDLGFGSTGTTRQIRRTLRNEAVLTVTRQRTIERAVDYEVFARIGFFIGEDGRENFVEIRSERIKVNVI